MSCYTAPLRLCHSLSALLTRAKKKKPQPLENAISVGGKYLHDNWSCAKSPSRVSDSLQHSKHNWTEISHEASCTETNHVCYSTMKRSANSILHFTFTAASRQAFNLKGTLTALTWTNLDFNCSQIWCALPTTWHWSFRGSDSRSTSGLRLTAVHLSRCYTSQSQATVGNEKPASSFLSVCFSQPFSAFISQQRTWAERKSTLRWSSPVSPDAGPQSASCSSTAWVFHKDVETIPTTWNRGKAFGRWLHSP